MKITKYFVLIAVILSSSLGLAQAQKPKVLVVLSDLNYVTMKAGNKHRTGYFLSEMALPMQSLIANSYDVVVATPTGKQPSMDPISDDPKWFTNHAEYQRTKIFVNQLAGLKNPVSLKSLTLQHLQQFAGIFVPGGHAPMEDLIRDKTLAHILTYFHQQQKPTALICHGPAALLSTYTPNQPWIYSGYKMTAFSNAEEMHEEKAGTLEGLMRVYLQDALVKAGGQVRVAKEWNSQVVTDRELITGQNPMSEKVFAEAFLQKLNQQKLKTMGTQFLQKLLQTPGIAATHYQGKMEAFKLYRLLQKSNSWRSGHTAIFLGTRKPLSSQKQFLTFMNQHVYKVTQAFSQIGLKNYVALSSGDFEIAFMNWESTEKMQAAMLTSSGKMIVGEAEQFMNTEFFIPVQTVPGALNFVESLR